MNFLPRCRLSYSKIVQTTQERHRHPVTTHLSRRPPLCLLRSPGRQSVAVRRAAALCVSYENLCNLCSRGKRLTQTSNLMSLCPSVSRVSGFRPPPRRQSFSPPRQRPVSKSLKNMFYSTNLQNIHPKTWHIHK